MITRILIVTLLAGVFSKSVAEPLPFSIKENERIVILGNGLGERMLYFPYFETELHRRFPGAKIIVRNISRSGDTAGFRPRAGRESQWAFPGAEQFHPDLKAHSGKGHYMSPDEWLAHLKADTILALFGYNESFDGESRIKNFYNELDAFITHTLSQKYNGTAAPRLVLVSPIAFENLSRQQNLPDGRAENSRLAAYTEAMRQVAYDRHIGFVDLFGPTGSLYAKSSQPLTINGFALTKEGYRKLAIVLATAIYGDVPPRSMASQEELYKLVEDKDWFWLNDYQMLNGIHVYGRREEPYGVVNYPEEIEKIRQMTALRDTRIHQLVNGESIDKDVDDRSTRPLTPIKSNFDHPIEYVDAEDLSHFKLPDGFKITLFASESEFPELQNPVRMSFDNKGRLWVSVAPSYPHYRPGDPRPNDKLLIFEDTNGDGRADKMTVFAENLQLPFGFELAPEGVYLAQQPNLVLLVDDDGDDRADRQEILLQGFDTHDTHQAIHAFSADASGAIYLLEGDFLHSQVETPYGPQRAIGGGVWRFDPKSWRLERFVQSYLANPWGLAFDEWDQPFLSDASGGHNWWALPLSAKVPYGYNIKKFEQFTTEMVRPTVGTEFVYSRHFPDELQGDFLINNVIGFQGTKEHTVIEDGAGGFTGVPRQDLVSSNDPSFRPVDLEFAPDGSLYILVWYNPLIGHMQHSARDPKRDHTHGRIYRLTYASRPLLQPAQVHEASIPQLLDNLKLHEYRSRYRSRRELRGRPPGKVLPAVKQWVANLDVKDPRHEHHLVEALWVTWGLHRVDTDLLKQCLNAKSHQARAAAVHVLRYAYRDVPGSHQLLMKAANDTDPQVRLEAVVAASWQDDADGAAVAFEAMNHPITKWMGRAFEAALLTLDPHIRALQQAGKLRVKNNKSAQSYLRGDLKLYEDWDDERIPYYPQVIRDLYFKGKEVYARDAHCKTCHGEDGAGVPGVYPPLRHSEWAQGDVERVIKIVLKGLWGPLTVNGQSYDPGKRVPPMPPFEHLLSDEEISAVVSYIRIKFADANAAGEPVFPSSVSDVRQAVKDRQSFYQPDELLREHPLPK